MSLTSRLNALRESTMAWRRRRAQRQVEIETDRLNPDQLDPKVAFLAALRDVLMDRRADRRTRTARAILYF